MSKGQEAGKHEDGRITEVVNNSVVELQVLKSKHVFMNTMYRFLKILSFPKIIIAIETLPYLGRAN